MTLYVGRMRSYKLNAITCSMRERRSYEQRAGATLMHRGSERPVNCVLGLTPPT